jgi:hypothetical protein
VALARVVALASLNHPGGQILEFQQKNKPAGSRMRAVAIGILISYFIRSNSLARRADFIATHSVAFSMPA